MVRVRPIRPADTDGLLDLYARLSPESRRSRFFTAGATKRRVDALRLTASTGQYDCVLVATQADQDEQRIVAVAQLADYGTAVEAALVVGDDYQSVGLGSQLFRLLLQAGAQRGVPAVDATVLSGNNRILRILRYHQAKLGPPENGVLAARIHPSTAGAVQLPDLPRRHPAEADGFTTRAFTTRQSCAHPAPRQPR